MIIQLFHFYMIIKFSFFYMLVQLFHYLYIINNSLMSSVFANG